ncbi:MAG: FHA domain-containing protein [Myxococcota bacterium]|jgi:pSer/pThr/pTyr-binding forkhead associated (FHA) protein|nr:FHA domain-containing protein [Myxococcota bacterium]
MDSKEKVPVPTGGSIQIQSGFYEGLDVLLDRDWMVIGRGRGADVVLAEATISRAHAAIGYDAEGFFVQDLGSTNGTLINGAKAERQALKHGDEVRMGRLVIGVTLPTA